MTAWVKLEPGIPALDHPTGWRAIERLETASISLVDPHRDISQQKILCVAASLFSVHDREALCRCIERWQHPVTSVTVYRCVQCGQCGQCGLLLRRHQEHWTLPGLAPLSSGPKLTRWKQQVEIVGSNEILALLALHTKWVEWQYRIQSQLLRHIKDTAHRVEWLQ